MDARPPHSHHDDSDETSPTGEVWAEPEASEPGAMGFLDHLEDLRWAIVKSLGAFLVGTVLVTIFLTNFARLLMWPYNFAISGRAETATMEGLIMTSFMGVFSVVFNLLMVGGVALGGPFVLYFFGSFISPGLTNHEKRLLIPGGVLGFILFLLGACFSFFLVVPMMLRASVFFNDLLGFTLLITADNYYSLLTWSVMGIGLSFEFPLLLLLLVYLGVLDVQRLKDWRHYSFVVFLVVAALVTPGGDPISLMLLALPMYLLYELAILLSRPVIRMRERARAEAEAMLDE
ncbi:MAG: twin-arginine translocase subunit TatC [Verrucomicrobiota bacterium JB022]|nr:twin-arginine translocase subunit TatC [Verrucomicrobiota bacterium JB022]